ncbi:hypothetical protein [Pontibacter harenae]|uniref:hypothetical protein n=1 Tax=Pontibacter harenae TaxID=2894083 RepID=UPI001E536CBF|nr:hypothetical protein [Pontibacter harenae]MCC9166476.1 hypothetical protein [Pontibacter harenae]
MKNLLWAVGFAGIILIVASCSSRSIEEDTSEATVANETGATAPIPSDVLLVTKPLVSGKIYTQPDFESQELASFDTSQTIHVIDTTHNLFVKARLVRDTTNVIGFVSRTILPEETQSR